MQLGEETPTDLRDNLENHAQYKKWGKKVEGGMLEVMFVFTNNHCM